MLANARMTTILPAKDLERARDFYEKRLGLSPLGAKPDGKFEFAVPGGVLALIPKPEGTKAEHTAVSFRGLRTTNHVCVLGSEKAAWFKDPEGNTLCLHEDIPN